MGILEFIVFAAVIGLVAYLVTTYVPMPAPVAQLIVIAVVILIVFVLLRALGVGDYPMPRVFGH